MVSVAPPVYQIFVSPDPRLPLSISDGRTDLSIPCLDRVIEPVIPLTPSDIRFQVVEVIDAPPFRVGMTIPTAPVAERHVVINPNKIYVGVRPERIKVEDLIGRTAGLVAVVFAPIRSIADLRFRSEDRANVGGELLQCLYSRKAAACPADLG